MAPLVAAEPAVDWNEGIEFTMQHYPLFKGGPEGETWGVFIRKEGEPVPKKETGEVTDDGKEAPSNQGVDTGRKLHPFDMEAARRLVLANVHHSSCLATLRDATTGLGFVSNKVAKTLDPLCKTSFIDLLNRICWDRYIGNGYMEVVRESPKQKAEIIGLHYLSPPDVHIYLENEAYDFHYEIETSEGRSTKFARFGDMERFLASKFKPAEQKRVSEVIHFQSGVPLDRWYGMGEWLSCIPYIELQMAILQHNFDFFKNSGVPDFMLFVTGGKVAKEDWAIIKAILRQHIGTGNHHKSLALNLPGSEVKITVHQLRAEDIQSTFQPMLESLALATVSGHRVPPLLAGIVIPGKLGANNELPNAIMAVQALVVGQAQTAIKTQLRNTLGNRKLNGGLPLFRDDDFEFNTILDHINLVQMEETGSLRDPVGGKDPDAPNSTKKPDQKKRAAGKPKTKVVRNP